MAAFTKNRCRGEGELAALDGPCLVAFEERLLDSFMESLIPFVGSSIADIGAGTGFHSLRYANSADRVFAVEPAPAMLIELLTRVARSGLTNISVIAADAADIPLRDASVDIVHSRFAYLFGPEHSGVACCESGIFEAMRILRRGGWCFIVENDLTNGEFARVFDESGYNWRQARTVQAQYDAFYATYGFDHVTIESQWEEQQLSILTQIVGMRFPPDLLATILAEIERSIPACSYRIYCRQK